MRIGWFVSESGDRDMYAIRDHDTIVTLINFPDCGQDKTSKHKLILL